jgi:hypothetical protein
VSFGEIGVGMSQSPMQGNPYSYGQGYAAYDNPLDQLLRPARMASIVMFVVGGLVLLLGGCLGAGGAMMFSKDPQVQAELQKALAGSGVTLRQMQPAVLVMAVLSLLAGVALVVMGVIVRKGTMAPVVTAMVLAAVLEAATLAMFVLSLVQSPVQAVCMCGLPIVAFGGLVVLLINAVKNARLVGQWKDYFRAAQAQYGQQAYGAAQGYGGYGFPVQPANPNPPPPPPPPPQ